MSSASFFWFSYYLAGWAKTKGGEHNFTLHPSSPQEMSFSTPGLMIQVPKKELWCWDLPMRCQIRIDPSLMGYIRNHLSPNPQNAVTISQRLYQIWEVGKKVFPVVQPARFVAQTTSSSEISSRVRIVPATIRNPKVFLLKSEL